MQNYSCVVRLAGTVTSEVPKPNVTAPEILILRSMHGPDSVVRIERTTMDKKSHGAERKRLEGIYGEKAVKDLFGNEFNRLPVRLDGIVDAPAKAGEPAAETDEPEEEAA